jgi:hypothetical protein
MMLWKKLYNTFLLAFFCCVLIPRWMGGPIGYPVHALLGLLLLFLTVSNARHLNKLPVPDRLKRISRVTAGFAIVQLATGLALGGVHHLVPDLRFVPTILQGIHVVCALAILSQASSVATAYDMWEEKEFQEGKESSAEQDG